MKKEAFSLLLALSLPTAVFAEQETVNTREKPFKVTYPDGSTETYVAKYKAEVNHSKWQSGNPAKPLKGIFIDTRQCHWHITTSVIRDVCLSSKSGQHFCEGALNRIYGTSFAGKGSDFVLTRLQSENCGDANARYLSDVNNARNAVRDALDGVMDNDLKQVISDMGTQLKANSVVAIEQVASNK